MSILPWSLRFPFWGRFRFWNCLSVYNLRPRRCLTVVAFGVVSTLYLWYNKTRGNHECQPSDENEGPEVEDPLEVVVQKLDSDSASKAPKIAGKRPADFITHDTESVKRQRGEEEEGERSEGSEYVVSEDDDFFCEYDTTWETSSSITVSPTDRQGSDHQKFWSFKRAARDMRNYRHDYVYKTNYLRWTQQASVDEKPNLNFYLGNRPSVPDDVYIEEFHNEWYGKYNKLERVHTFIQWLFPLQEPGVNNEAWTLTKVEIKEFLESTVAKENLLKSYKLMLDFYGIKLSNEETGEVQRASNWEERSVNLNSNTHNNLRITRILKCLGTLGFSHYQAPLVQFFLEETLVHRELPNVKESMLNYFMFAVLDRKERRKLIKYAFLNYEPKEDFVWCPKKIQATWAKEAGIEYPIQPLRVMVEDDNKVDYYSNMEYV